MMSDLDGHSSGSFLEDRCGPGHPPAPDSRKGTVSVAPGQAWRTGSLPEYTLERPDAPSSPGCDGKELGTEERSAGLLLHSLYRSGLVLWPHLQ